MSGGSETATMMAERFLLQSAREAVAVPYEHGHGDVGDALVSYLKGELSMDEAAAQIDLLQQHYEECQS